jgi:hypothetical protein
MTQALRSSFVRNEFSSATSKQVAHHLAEPVNFIRESPAQKKPVAVVAPPNLFGSTLSPAGNLLSLNALSVLKAEKLNGAQPAARRLACHDPVLDRGRATLVLA